MEWRWLGEGLLVSWLCVPRRGSWLPLPSQQSFGCWLHSWAVPLPVSSITQWNVRLIKVLNVSFRFNCTKLSVRLLSWAVCRSPNAGGNDLDKRSLQRRASYKVEDVPSVNTSKKCITRFPFLLDLYFMEPTATTIRSLDRLEWKLHCIPMCAFSPFSISTNYTTDSQFCMRWINQPSPPPPHIIGWRRQ